MQSLGLGSLEDFDFIEPPDHRLVNDGRKLLIELGAMTEKNPLKLPTKSSRQLLPALLKGEHKGINQDRSANGENAD